MRRYLITLAVVGVAAAAAPSAHAAFPGRNGRIAYIRIDTSGCGPCGGTSAVHSIRPDGSERRREWSGQGPRSLGLAQQYPQEVGYSPGGGRLLVAADAQGDIALPPAADFPLSILPLGHRSRPLLTRGRRVVEGGSPSWS